MKILLSLLILFSQGDVWGATLPPSTGKPLSLEEGLKKALANSRDIKSQKDKVQAAESHTSKANAEYFPALNLVAATGTYHDRNPVAGNPVIPTIPRDRNVYDAHLELTEVIFSGFSTAAEVQGAKAAKSEEEQKMRAAQGAVRSDFLETYFGLQLVRRKIAAEEEILAMRKSRLDQVGHRVKQGRATELDVLQSRYAVQSQDPALNSLRASLEQSSIHLNRIIGADVTDQYELTDNLISTSQKLDSSPRPSLADAFQKAVANNADLRQVEAQSDRLNAELKLEDSKNLPVVSLTGLAGVNTYMQNEIGSQNANEYGVLLQVNAPLFSGLSGVYSSQEKRSQLDSITESRAKAREQLLERLQQVYRQIDVNRQNVLAAGTNVQISKQTVTRADTLYASGRATLTDVLDSYSKRLEAERTLADAQFQTIVTLGQLKTLLGD